ncbi:hypothetical protein UA08_08039 [Talaromyces atroroseus]|uniref:Uncharacterized protein n=1 Tax=Talaromyces atroroseus TaxID=1441469 RepID=A0A225A850_TALAT|nr:hypothetical protein UA08_08039 [Talaromyces atroroseus]OKL56891.1 hypothetical protein UA08_08039 [Talaromyces atroroseus]
MPPLTETTLTLHESLCNQPNPNINASYATRVVQQEQIRQYFLQLGIQKGHDLEIGEGCAETSHQGKGTRPSSASVHSNTERSDLPYDDGDDAEQQDQQQQQQKENFVSLSHSLKLFMPRQRENHHEESHHSNMQDSTPLERFVTLDGCSDPSYISRVAVTQAGCYGHMESVDARQRQAQLLAEQVVRDANVHRGSSPDSMRYI